MIREKLEQYWGQLAAMTLMMPAQPLAAAARLLAECHRHGGTVFVLGNGGSAATASHFACDLAKGTLTQGVPAFRVVPLTDNNALLTAWANDISFERVFSEQLAALARPGDLLLAISTSGNSPNVVAAVQVAQLLGVMSIAFTGPEGGRLLGLADLTIPTPAGTIEQVEDLHLAMCHSLCVTLRCQLAEQAAGPVLVEEDLTSELWAS